MLKGGINMTKKNNTSSFDDSKLFCEYCDDWIAFQRHHVKESTIAKYIRDIEKYHKPFFGCYKPELITINMIADFTHQLSVINMLSPKTTKDLLVVLKSIFKFISYYFNIDLVEISIPKIHTKSIKVLSGEEQIRFVNYLYSEIDLYKFAVLLALMTGLRIGEICALRCGDISLQNKTVTVSKTIQRIKNLSGNGAKTKIVFTEPKSDSSDRIVPLTDSAFKLCKNQINTNEPDAFLLTGSKEKYIEPRTLQNKIKQYGTACGIDDLHFHILRHTFATRCVEVGFEIKSLSEILGHSNPQFTMERYVHSSIEFKRQNMKKLESIGL